MFKNTWANSSAGRAPALQAGGHRFKPCFAHHAKCHAVVAQLVEHRVAIAKVASSSLVYRSSTVEPWCSWLTRRPVTPEIAGSSPVGSAIITGV